MTETSVLVMSADEGYAMQLAVAIRSLLDHMGSDEKLELYVIDGGLTAESKMKCEASWNGPLNELRWIQPPKKKFSRMKASDHYSIATYYRLILSDLLPDKLNRVVYSDPDVLFFKSLASIFCLDLHEKILAAVQDPYCPYIDSRIGLANFKEVREYVFGLAAVPPCQGNPVNPNQPYFNAGFFLADLEIYRRDGVGAKLLKYCVDHRDELLWADQCALNACLGDRWQPLDASWNVIPHVFETPDQYLAIYDQSTLDRIRTSPAMVHFAGPRKPWSMNSSHPFTQTYLNTIDRTSWNGWRPTETVDPLRMDSTTPQSVWKFYRNWLPYRSKKAA